MPGPQRDFPLKARAPPSFLSPLLPQPWPFLFPLQQFPCLGNTVQQGGAPSRPGKGKAAVEAAGKQAQDSFLFTIVLREKPACFQVKLLLTDLLLEPELQVGPVPREERGKCRHQTKSVVPKPTASPHQRKAARGQASTEASAQTRYTGPAAPRPGQRRPLRPCPARRDAPTADRPRIGRGSASPRLTPPQRQPPP